MKVNERQVIARSTICKKTPVSVFFGLGGLNHIHSTSCPVQCSNSRMEQVCISKILLKEFMNFWEGYFKAKN